MKRILIDGRFIGVGESMTRYALGILPGILAADNENEYTLLLRPQGKEVIEKFLRGEACQRVSVSASQRISESACLGGRRASQPFGFAQDKQVSSSTSPGTIKSADSLTCLPADLLKLKVLDIPHYSRKEQTELLGYLNKEKFDLVHFIQFNHPIRYRGKFVVTVHDLTLLGYLHRSQIAKRLAFGIVMRSAVKNAAKVIAVSKTTKDEILEYYKIKKDKIVVTRLGIEQDRFNPNIAKGRTEQFKKKYGIEEDYLLYTGMWKGHKNLVRLLKAFEQVKSEIRNPKSENKGLQLVLVGKRDEREKGVIAEIERINKISALRLRSGQAGKPFDFAQGKQVSVSAGKLVVTTGFIDDDELPAAYAGALAYVIPSLSEGFGLPPLEAMACGTPVISSNVSCMPEILADAPLYFDPYKIDDIASAITKVVGDPELQKELSEKGIKQAAKYQWDKTAKETLEVYRSVL